MFNKDERYIKKQFGKKNPFAVPKGYFDVLPFQVMKTIKETGKMPNVTITSAKVVTLSPWKRYRTAIVSVAAGVCVAMLSLGVYFHSDDSKVQKPVVAQHEKVITPTTDYSTLDAAVDYSMMDSEDMYAYMADLN